MELIVDFSWLWNRSYFAFKDFQNSEGDLTGAMYGVLKFHEAIADKGYKIVACLDDISNFRKEVYEDYKANREVDVERVKAKRCNQSLFEILSYLGWEFYKTEGCEADDLIASRAMENAKAGNPCVVYSSDKDLQQLMIFPSVQVASSIEQGQFVYKTEQDTIEKLGCSPSQIRYFRPFKGDTSDNIPSAVSRIQSKHLVPIAKDIEDGLVLGLTLENAYDKAITKNKSKLTSSAFQKLVEGRETYVRNFIIMDLIKWYHNPIPQNKVEFRTLTETGLFELLDKYELKEFKGNYIDNLAVRGLL